MGLYERSKQERAERAAESGGGRRFIKHSPVGIQVRFLEDLPEIEKQSRFMHRLPAQPPAKKWAWYEVCLARDEEGNETGEACPGCEGNEEEWGAYPCNVRGFVNVIWRDAPKQKRDKEGKYKETDEVEDAIVVWNFGPSITDKLYELHLTYKDLTSRDFVVKRTGSGFDTVYSIQPYTDEDGETKKAPMSKADKELAAEKYDFEPDVTPKSYEDWGKVKSRAKSDDGPGESAGNSDNPFKKKKQEDAE